MNYFERCVDRVNKIKLSREIGYRSLQYGSTNYVFYELPDALVITKKTTAVLGETHYQVTFKEVEVPLEPGQAEQLFNMIQKREMELSESYKSDILKEL